MIWYNAVVSTASNLEVKDMQNIYHSRFFVQIWHEITHASSGNCNFLLYHVTIRPTKIIKRAVENNIINKSCSPSLMIFNKKKIRKIPLICNTEKWVNQNLRSFRSSLIILVGLMMTWHSEKKWWFPLDAYRKVVSSLLFNFGPFFPKVTVHKHQNSPS